MATRMSRSRDDFDVAVAEPDSIAVLEPSVGWAEGDADLVLRGRRVGEFSGELRCAAAGKELGVIRESSTVGAEARNAVALFPARHQFAADRAAPCVSLGVMIPVMVGSKAGHDVVEREPELTQCRGHGLFGRRPVPARIDHDEPVRCLQNVGIDGAEAVERGEGMRCTPRATGCAPGSVQASG